MSIQQPASKVLTLSIGLLIANLYSTTIDAATAKHVAVPPDKMDQQKLPSAQSKGIFSHSTMLPIFSNQAKLSQSFGQSQLTLQKNIYFDGNENTPLIFIGPNVEQWKLTVTSPSGQQLLNENRGNSSTLKVQSIAVGQQSFKGKKLLLNNPETGNWKVTLSRKADTSKTKQFSANQSVKAEGFLMFKGDPSYKLYSYLDNNFTLQNKSINIVAYVVDNTNRQTNRKVMIQKRPMPSSITNAFATITSPSKKQTRLRLRDDGRGGDKLAGDGLYSAKIPTSEIGVYTSQVQIQGIRPDGIRFSRTATDIYPIEKSSFQLLRKPAQLKRNADGQMSILVSAKKLGKQNNVYMSAEVWGTNPKGQLQSAAWLGGIVSAKTNRRAGRSNSNLELKFDPRWLSRNQLSAPYRLKSIRLQAVDTNVPISAMKDLRLVKEQSLRQRFLGREKGLNGELSFNRKNSNLKKVDKTITQQMLMGSAPISTKVSTKAAGTKLLLVHGYCSSSVWNTANFSNSAEFKDYNQNRSNEDFAQRIMSFGSPYSSYGIVAHSQGGAAALHIYTRYWSGLDYATGGRIIQSLGTPYRGTALAGNLAVIGEVFGAGCGKNTDLTYSGAANWLSTIPSWARSQVDYYTTSFATKWWRYDYCHLATDLFLDDPEDGTTEKWSGQLSGGVNKGHKTGWCHTRGMRDTAQYFDSSRNASMNSRAAR